MLCTILSKLLRGLMPVLALFLSGCGITQTISDSTTSTMKSVFLKRVKVLHLELRASKMLNTDIREHHPLTESVVVQIYQLKERAIFDGLIYQQILQSGDSLLQPDLLARRDVLVEPKGSVHLNMPLDNETRFVAIIALFRHPDMRKNSWKKVIVREAFYPDKPRVLELSGNAIVLLPSKK